MATVAEKREVKENKKGEGKQDNVMQYSRFMPRYSTEMIALQRRHTLTQHKTLKCPNSTPKQPTLKPVQGKVQLWEFGVLWGQTCAWLHSVQPDRSAIPSRTPDWKQQLDL